MNDATPLNASVALRWSAYEHAHIERGQDWYWALGIVTLCVVVISILLGDVLFGALIVIAAITIGMHARVRHDMANFEISDRGIRINGTLHRYDEIISFWVEDEHHDGRPLLLVDTTKPLSPNFIIPIEHVEPAKVRAYLKERAKEVHMREPVAHKILEFFGF